MLIKKANKSKNKLSNSEIMERVINVEELEKRKEAQIKEVPIIKEEIIIEKELKWWELPMKKNLFKTKKIKNKFYGNYEDWGETVWIGPYDSDKELNGVIKSYIEETKKPISERKIENIHSIIIKE